MSSSQGAPTGPLLYPPGSEFRRPHYPTGLPTQGSSIFAPMAGRQASLPSLDMTQFPPFTGPNIGWSHQTPYQWQDPILGMHTNEQHAQNNPMPWASYLRWGLGNMDTTNSLQYKGADRRPQSPNLLMDFLNLLHQHLPGLSPRGQDTMGAAAGSFIS